MTTLRFEWDEQKNLRNQAKHGVSFEEAESVFYDENARLKADPDYSIDEERFILLGFSKKLRLLVVCHCYRDRDDVIRLISARKAERPERKQYNRFYDA
jgi:uncharacterized DUF497 family protein